MATTINEQLKKTAEPVVATQTAAVGGNDNASKIGAMYDQQLQAQKSGLEATYQQNKSDLEANKAKISPMYQAQANDLATQYERNRRNNNMQAAANGLNTGTASQLQLGQQSAWQRDYGALRGQEAEAHTEADRNLANLKAQYNSNVQQATANIGAQKTAALIDESNRQQSLDLDKAKTLAGYGDFSGYAALYGNDVAKNMADLWASQNPDLAWNTGKIDGERYKAITGKYPIGYTPAGGGGGGYQGMTTSDYGYENPKGLTTSQIKEIQTALGVTPDGVWGDITENAYNAANDNNTPKTKVDYIYTPPVLQMFEEQMGRK